VTVTIAPDVRQRTRAKVRVLLDALPFLREHAGSTMVIKVGGAVMDDGAVAESFALDIALLRLVGVQPVVVHGGGPQISAMARRMGLEPVFVDGLRVTDEATLEVARMVLLGLLNQDLVGRLVRHGTPAIGVSGTDDALLVVAPRPPELGLGLVGDVERVNAGLLRHLLERLVPVVATIGTDPQGRHHNVNADTAAAAIAAALGADKLIYLTDVPGLLGADGDLVSELTVEECRSLIAGGVATGGMIPKLDGAVEAMEAGVRRTHLIDGRVEHALVLELFTPEGIGTMLTRDQQVDLGAGTT